MAGHWRQQSTIQMQKRSQFIIDSTDIGDGSSSSSSSSGDNNVDVRAHDIYCIN